MKRWPLLTIHTALLAIAIYAWPGAREFCVLDRGAFLHGEWWRAFTAHLVHFSPGHLWLNVAVFFGASGVIEMQSRRLLLALFASASVAISVAVLVFASEFQFYGGLSGVATAMLFLMALHCAGEKGGLRVCGLLVIAAALAKLVFEGLNPQPLFARFDSSLIRSAPISHAAGIIAAVAIWCATRAPRHSQRPNLKALLLQSNGQNGLK
jgi:rhomboid family GlyGly-CTERM serine protease